MQGTETLDKSGQRSNGGREQGNIMKINIL
jgi:hypothetical protein